jgi:hypothetical protein
MSDKLGGMGDLNQDPSMEEILASIKRVIAEDGRNAAAASRPARRPRAEAPPLPPEDVLELDEPVGEPDDTLVSEDAAAASRQSLAALAAMRAGGEPPPLRAGEGPLEAVIRDMLRPMLKEWLDDNLPPLVERLVREEIERVSRGRR